MADSNWDSIYRYNKVEDLPWFSPKLDDEIRSFITKNRTRRGSFLDLGTGPATQAIELAKLGFDVSATDISEVAIKKARERARREKVKITFHVDDILNTKLKAKQFDYIYDRGVFHTIDPSTRERFVGIVKLLLKENGTYFLKCFSTRTPGNWGPYRFTKEQIIDYFGKDFVILSIKYSVYPGTLEENPVTLFCVMRPRATNK